MKKILVLLIATTMAACSLFSPTPTLPPAQAAQLAYAKACSDYGAALYAAAALRQQGKLSAAAVQQVTLLDQQITPLCTPGAAVPADPTLWTNQIVAAVTSFAAIDAVTAITKK